MTEHKVQRKSEINVKKHFVEAIWSKVDNFISQIFPTVPTKVEPPGDTNFGWHSKYKLEDVNNHQKVALLSIFLPRNFYAHSLTSVLQTLVLHTKSCFLVGIFLSTPPLNFPLAPSQAPTLRLSLFKKHPGGYSRHYDKRPVVSVIF